VLKNSKLRIFAALLIAVVAWLIVCFELSLIPTYAEICEKNQYTGQKDCATYYSPLVFLWHVGKRLNDYSGLLTAVATIFVVWLTWILSRIAEQQEKSAQVIERAHLAFEDFKIVNEARGTAVSVSIKNYGRSHGRVTHAWVQITLAPMQLDCAELKPPSSGFFNPMPIAPNASDVPGLAPLRTDQWADVISKKRNLFVYGSVQYIDIFDKSHASGFACQYIYPDDVFQPICVETHWYYT